MDSFLGEVRILPYTFAPYGWAVCNGQQMNLAQNAALYSLLGIVFGGDGRATFQLPNIPAGSTVIGSGQGTGLTNRTPGPNAIGSTSATLTTATMPNHTHQMNAYSLGASQPASAYTGIPSTSTRTTSAENQGSKVVFAYNGTNPASGYLAVQSVGAVGGGLPHPNEQPFLPMGYYISLDGEYPSFP